MPVTEDLVKGSTSPSTSPRQPFFIPNTSASSTAALRTTARMTAFRPGQSPPAVRIPMCLLMVNEKVKAFFKHLKKAGAVLSLSQQAMRFSKKRSK
jgi:hypothetical protein